MAGQISVLVSRELQTILTIAKALPRDVASQMRKWTRSEAQPIWRDEIAGRAKTKTQASVLEKTARIAVSDTNVTMKSATIGKTHGVPNWELAPASEFGMFENKQIAQRSSRGRTYKRRAGRMFRRPTPDGYVFHPAAHESTPRFASLWMQTVYRTVAEMFEKGAS